MRDYITIGPCPTEEDCVSVGEANYPQRARIECSAFRAQLRRVFGDEQGSAHLVVKSFPHDFGSYHEVVCYFDDTDPVGTAYAYRCEGETPETWDATAKAEMATKNDIRERMNQPQEETQL